MPRQVLRARSAAVLVASLASSSWFTLVACTSTTINNVYVLTDASPSDATMANQDGASSSDGGMGEDANVPPGCDTSKDLTSQPACVTEASGLFVSAGGSDSAGTGTKAAPYASIGKAIGASDADHARIFICAGTYAEHVVISSNVSLYGGLDCATWTPPATAPATPSSIVKPSDTGYALNISGTSSVVIEELELDAQDGVDAGESSVAVFAGNANGVTFVRDTIVAGNAGPTPDKASTLVNYTGATADGGLAPTGADGTDPLTCACLVSGTSLGGGSGEAGNNGGGPGGDGGPSLPSNPTGVIPAHDGKAGSGASGGNGCSNGDPGANSVDADGGAAASTFGTLTTSGWLPSLGTAGASAGAAQGGGGGGGAMMSGGAGAGGGGGCGGCGGGAGSAGSGGGSSFGVLSFQSTLTFDTCSITAKTPSAGGPGGDGQSGQLGGTRAAGNGNGCNGGPGGNGGHGGGGGGGAAGISVGIGYVGTSAQAPTLTNTSPMVSSTVAAGGSAGDGGTAGSGLSGTNMVIRELSP